MTQSQVDKKVKLSNKQKEVIKMMRNGCVMRKTVFDNTILSDEKGFTFKVNAATRYSLIYKNILTAVFPIGTYELTELGKTINI